MNTRHHRTGALFSVLLLTFVHSAHAFLMWTAAKDGQALHVLAHIPLLSEEPLTQLWPAIEESFEQSSLVVFESDLDPEARKERFRQILAAGHYPEGENILQKIPRRVLLEYSTFNRSMGVESEETYQLRPWLAAQQVLHVAALRVGIRPTTDMEQLLFVQAQEHNKPIAHLNEADDTLHLYTSMTEDMQIRVLQKSLRDAQAISNTLHAIQKEWLAGSADRAASLVGRAFTGFEPLRDFLFTSRNVLWARRLEEKSQAHEAVFVIVALSHLVGPNSLLNQLEYLGYSIQQVKPPNGSR